MKVWKQGPARWTVLVVGVMRTTKAPDGKYGWAIFLGPWHWIVKF